MSLSQTLYYAMPVAAQNLMVTTYGYYLKRKRHGADADGIRRLIAASRSWSAEDVARYQSRQLSRILAAASRAPYYHEAWAKIDLQKIAAIDHLVQLPLLPKETVRREGARLLVPGARPYWTQHTSGSTGTPVVVHVNRETYHLVHALLEEHERSCGVEPTDLRGTFAGRMVQPADRLEPPFWRYNAALRQLLFSAYHMTPGTLPYYVEELKRRQPAELIGYPSALATLAAYINSSGQQKSVRPRVVVTNSETLFAWQRDAIEEAFGCRVCD